MSYFKFACTDLVGSGSCVSFISGTSKAVGIQQVFLVTAGAPG